VTQDVLAHGDDSGAGRSRGTLVGVVALLALLGGGIALARSGNDAPPRPVASPSPSQRDTESPAPEPPDDPFARFVTLPRPASGTLATPVRLLDDLPGYLVTGPDGVQALSALTGPEHATVLLGWCAASQSFQDAAGTYRYDSGGARALSTFADPYLLMAQLALRTHATDLRRVDVGGPGAGREPRLSAEIPRCPAGRLVLPPLPPRVTDLTAAAGRYRRSLGRYVTRTDSRAFCPEPLPLLRCATGGWEVNGLGQLPPEDLVGAYTYEGEFLVRTAPRSGDFEVVLLPGSRLVRREGVGVRAVSGVPQGTRTAGGRFLLAIEPSGPPAATSPPLREYVVRSDVDLHLDRGVTGLGQPSGTTTTLRVYVAVRGASALFWLILDGQDQVLRVVAQPLSAGQPTQPAP
jgi:hypothetical protein